jgi:hypothetical protein
LVGLLGFFGATLIGLANVVSRPKRFRWNAVVQRFDVVGIRALGIIGLMSFLIGIVIGQQGAVQLQQFGAEVYTINLIGRITVRELGTLISAEPASDLSRRDRGRRILRPLPVAQRSSRSGSMPGSARLIRPRTRLSWRLPM